LGFVVVNYNVHEQLERSLECIKTQARKDDRVVVVENGNRNSVFERRWIEQGVEFLFPGVNTGFAGGNNLAVRHLDDCEWVILVNPDAYLGANWIASMLDATIRHPDAASLCGRLVQSEREYLLDGLGDAYHLSGLVWRIGHGTTACAEDMAEREVFSACAAAAVYRRSAFMEVGGFDESFFCYVEDVDLGFRLRLAGYSCWLIPHAVAKHVGSVASGGQKSDFQAYHGHRNLEWAYFKNMPALILVLTFPLHLLLVLVSVGLLAVRGQGALGLKAKWDALRGMRRIWRARSAIQSRRRASASDLFRVMDKSVFRRC
jgi:GT2 family glycosyltransferase